MKKLITILMLTSFFCMTTACSTVYIVGKNFDDTQVNDLVIGETDKIQVLQRFGEPFNRGLINHSTAFFYTYEENVFPPHSGTEVYVDKRYKSLMIVFDEQDKVKHFAHNFPLTTGTYELMIHQEKINQREVNDDINSDDH